MTPKQSQSFFFFFMQISHITGKIVAAVHCMHAKLVSWHDQALEMGDRPAQ